MHLPASNLRWVTTWKFWCMYITLVEKLTPCCFITDSKQLDHIERCVTTIDNQTPCWKSSSFYYPIRSYNGTKLYIHRHHIVMVEPPIIPSLSLALNLKAGSVYSFLILHCLILPLQTSIHLLWWCLDSATWNVAWPTHGYQLIMRLSDRSHHGCIA